MNETFHMTFRNVFKRSNYYITNFFRQNFQYDYNESLNLCDLLSCFYVMVVYFSLYYSIVDQILVENI